MEQINIRQLVHADISSIMDIERRSFDTPWSMTMFVLELSRKDGVAIGAELQGRLIGFLICTRFDLVWHLMNIAVDPDQRRQGVAQKLMHAMLERTGGDAGKVTLEVRPKNSGAIKLYEKFGFAVAGVRRRYYPDTGEDAIIMWRTPAILAGSFQDVPNADPSGR